MMFPTPGTPASSTVGSQPHVILPQMLLQPSMFMPQSQPQVADQETRKGPGFDTRITTASLPIFKLPKVRLSEAIECVHDKLDSTMTAELNQSCLAVVLWMLTQVKCNMKVHDLRCDTYGDLYKRFKVAAQRASVVNDRQQKEIVDDLLSQRMLTEEFVLDKAVAFGFNPEWLQTPQRKKSGDIARTQQLLTQLFRRKQESEASEAPPARAKKVARREEPSEEEEEQASGEDESESETEQSESSEEPVPGSQQNARPTNVMQQPSPEHPQQQPRREAQPQQEAQAQQRQPRHQPRQDEHARQEAQPQQHAQAQQQARPQQMETTETPGNDGDDGEQVGESTEGQAQPPPNEGEARPVLRAKAKAKAKAKSRAKPPTQRQPKRQSPWPHGRRRASRHDPASGRGQQAAEHQDQPRNGEGQQQQTEAASAGQETLQQGPTCSFCLEALEKDDRTAPVEALACGHAHHAACIARYCEVTGRSRETACPLKCAVNAEDAHALLVDLTLAGAAAQAPEDAAVAEATERLRPEPAEDANSAGEMID